MSTLAHIPEEVVEQFVSVDALLRRARHQIDDVKSQTRSLARGSGRDLSTYCTIERDTRGEYLAIRRKDILPFPDLHMMAIEAIHHLYCALDHLAFSLKSGYEGEERCITFAALLGPRPRNKDARIFRRNVRKNYHKHQEIINSIRERSESALVLELLADADNRLKHRTVLTVTGTYFAPLFVDDARLGYAYKRDPQEVREGHILARGDTEDQLMAHLGHGVIEFGFSDEFNRLLKEKATASGVSLAGKGLIGLLELWHGQVSKLSRDWIEAFEVP